MSSDRGGSDVSDTTSCMEQLSVFSSAANIESSITFSSSTSTHGLGGKDTDTEKSSLMTSNTPQQVMQPVY